MKWYAKDMSKIGFRGSNIFESNWHHFYYREVTGRKMVYIFDALDERVQHFKLTGEEWKKFKGGALSLVPVGCCNATGSISLEYPIIDFEGSIRDKFKTKKKFLEYLDNLCNS